MDDQCSTTMVISFLLSTTAMVVPAISSSASAPHTKTLDFQLLSAALPGKVFFPVSHKYILSLSSYFAAFEDELAPTCVIWLASAQDVSTITITVKSFGPSGQVHLVVGGGGHRPWAGAANIQSGITLDLQDLTGVTINPCTRIASIGSGDRWSSVYSQLGTHELAVAGGRVSKVGVAGLITGGKSKLPTQRPIILLSSC